MARGGGAGEPLWEHTKATHHSMGDIQTDDDEGAHANHGMVHGSSSDQLEVPVHGGWHRRTRGARPPTARLRSSCVRPRAGGPQRNFVPHLLLSGAMVVMSVGEVMSVA